MPLLAVKGPYLPIGQKVLVGDPPKKGEEDTRRLGEVRGIQVLEEPVSYLVLFNDSKSPGNSYFHEDQIAEKPAKAAAKASK